MFNCLRAVSAVFPLGAGLGIGSFFSWFFARIKHKNIFKIILSALGVGLYLFLVIAGNNASEPDDTVLTDLIIALSNALYPVFYAAKGGVYGGWGLLAAVGLSALVAGIYFAVVGKCYKKINDATIVGMLIVVPVSAVNFLVTFVLGSYYYAWAVNILLFAADSAVFIRYFRKNGDALLSAL